MDHRHTSLPAERIEALKSRIDRSIVLVGMMGVGKSSVGKRLAALLGFGFVDADVEIETAAQMSISEIFDAHGESYFRDGERRVIARLLASADQPRVIATGGGAFCNAQTRQLILEQAITVWLDSDLDTLVERTSRKNDRPLLQQGDPREILARLKEERQAAYCQAPLHVHSSSGSHADTIDTLLESLDKWL